MTHGESDFDRHAVPPRSTNQLAAATVLLMVPLVALLWVSTFAKKEPVLAGFPFFIWYQFLWVFLCSACTWAAYHLVQVARPPSVKGARGKEGAPKGKGKNR